MTPLETTSKIPEEFTGEKKEIKESEKEIPYIKKLIMEAEKPYYPPYGKARKMTSEEIREGYDTATERSIERSIRKVDLGYLEYGREKKEWKKEWDESI